MSGLIIVSLSEMLRAPHTRGGFVFVKILTILLL
jgi:hypothetical protein